MTFSTEYAEIYQRVVDLCNLCDVETPPLSHLSSPFEIRQEILHLLSKGIDFINELKEVEDEYRRLEESIQKKQSDIRKHIGLQQQLKLYSDSLEQQLDQSEQARSQFIEKTRRMLSDLKRDNHFLHEQNLHLKEQMTFTNEDASRNKTFNIDVDLKKHTRTQSSKEYIQKNPSRQKFGEIYSSVNKNIEILRKNLEIKESLVSVDRKKEIQKKIKQLNEKNTIDEHSKVYDKLYSNSSYHEFYPRKEAVSKKPQRGSLRKNNSSSKKKYLQYYEEKSAVEKTHCKTKSVQKET